MQDPDIGWLQEGANLYIVSAGPCDKMDGWMLGAGVRYVEDGACNYRGRWNGCDGKDGVIAMPTRACMQYALCGDGRSLRAVISCGRLTQWGLSSRLNSRNRLCQVSHLRPCNRTRVCWCDAKRKRNRHL